VSVVNWISRNGRLAGEKDYILTANTALLEGSKTMCVKAEGRRAKDVAEAAGVSRSAVSRAFNPKSYLDPKKRAHVLKIASELGYHPNMAARAMVTNRSCLIAVLLPTLQHPWESQELDVLTGELQAMGFATLVYKISSTELRLDQVAHLKAYNPDSIIVYSDNLPIEGVKSLFSRIRPIFPVYLCEGQSELTEAGGDSGADKLVIDQRPGIRHAISLLAGAGCKDMVWLAGDPASRSNLDRQRIVLQVAGQFGITVSAHIQGDFGYERAREEVRAYYRAHPMSDALFAANDVSAFGAIDALRHDLGRAIPEDIKVVGFDNIKQSGWKSYDLTTVGMDIDARVSALVRLIRNRLQDPAAPDLVEGVETRLVVRGTVS
jgi:DNA-binding LacI/PurR family transcriptional regulator